MFSFFHLKIVFSLIRGDSFHFNESETKVFFLKSIVRYAGVFKGMQVTEGQGKCRGD